MRGEAVKSWTIAILLLAAACTPAAEEPTNQVEPADVEQEEAAPVPQLAGDWRVTAINGQDLTQYYTMNASFAGDRLTIASDCVRIAWSYSQQRNVVAFTPAEAASCDRMRTHNEDQVKPIVTQANIAMFSDEGRQVELSGPGGRVAMTRP